MEIITLKVNDSVADKFRWLLGHFSKEEIDVVGNIDTTALSPTDFDYISDEQMSSLKNIANDYKQGSRGDFEEYVS